MSAADFFPNLSYPLQGGHLIANAAAAVDNPAAWQTYRHDQTMTLSDPNNIVSTVSVSGGLTRVVNQNAGTVWDTPDDMAMWRAGLRDGDGAALTLDIGDVINVAIRLGAALPADFIVCAIVYDGDNGDVAPGAATEGYGVVITSDGAGGQIVNRIQNAGSWATGVASTPAQTLGRIGVARAIDGNSATGSTVSAGLFDANMVRLEGNNDALANLDFDLMDTFAFGIGYAGAGAANSQTVDILGGAFCFPIAGTGLEN